MLTKYIDQYVLIQMAILLAIVLFAPFMHIRLLNMPIVGIAFLMIGFVIMIISARQLGPALTPVVAPKENAQLVTSGMYGIVRHPIYTGVIILAIGWALLWGSLLSLLFSFVLIVFFDVKIKKEELLLSQKFPDYEDYKSRVKYKLIPFLY